MYLKFRYKNHRLEDHEYVIEPEKIELDETKGWIMIAQTITRDDDPREDMWPDRRRSFVLTEIQGLVQIERESETKVAPSDPLPVAEPDAATPEDLERLGVHGDDVA